MKKMLTVSMLLALILLVNVPNVLGGYCPPTIYVDNGVVVGGPLDGQPYEGTLIGTSGPDCMQGTNENDIILGKGGNDELRGMSGDDTINGGAGADLLFGEEGNDTLIGGAGNDTIYGELGDDLMKGGGDNDFLSAGGNFDLVIGGPGDDVIYCGSTAEYSTGRYTREMANGGSGFDDAPSDACHVYRSVEDIGPPPP